LRIGGNHHNDHNHQQEFPHATFLWPLSLTFSVLQWESFCIEKRVVRLSEKVLGKDRSNIVIARTSVKNCFV
jgi:hypothetical protein